MKFLRDCLFTAVASLAPCLSLFADEGQESGMIMIEIVEDPGFFELYGNYVYIAIILLALGFFFWNRYRQGRNRS